MFRMHAGLEKRAEVERRAGLERRAELERHAGFGKNDQSQLCGICKHRRQ